MLVATFAVAFLLQSIALLRRRSRRHARRARRLARVAEPPLDDLVGASTSARSRSSRSSSRSSASRLLVLLLARTQHRPAHARRRDRLRDRAAARRPRGPRDRARPCCSRASSRPRSRVLLTVQNAARHAGLRAARHDRRPRRRRRRRDDRLLYGDARRLRDRLRVRPASAARSPPTRASTSCRPSSSALVILVLLVRARRAVRARSRRASVERA